ncbi:hypothetical protein [Iningainema tapete]|uniref:Uncharacterized protein n=1 Tax=Iningainema tapete BLCC-T55 TaxID=2748662 RepID=A0A8J6XNL4_9CYAN|nr:hypothetical protein [Iningainema tapete]MBD2775240.1 hypothetical protein [Iningainema tapete BLCC-T55]
MSGSKAFVVTAGVSPTASLGALVAGAAVVGGVVGVVIAAGAVVSLTGKALQSYQERRNREREAALQRESEIQQRIAQIRAGIGSRKDVSWNVSTKVAVLPDTTERKDAQIRVDKLNNRLPKIRTEYQTLIEQQLLDAQTVEQALLHTQQALNANNLAAAEAYLQALDDMRIQVMQLRSEQLKKHVQYLQERLDGLRSRIPYSIFAAMQYRIDQQQSDIYIEDLHQLLTDLETQADQIHEMAENLVASWLQVGYAARVLDTDDGDVVIEVETHEGANTQMRVQFEGQQIDLFGPPEETDSCATRTVEALKIFQEQGYQLQWTQWDGQPVSEELQHIYSTTPQQSATTSYSSVRRQQSLGY